MQVVVTAPVRRIFGMEQAQMRQRPQPFASSMMAATACPPPGSGWKSIATTGDFRYGYAHAAPLESREILSAGIYCHIAQ
jgi:hypothetical protein